MWQQRGAAAATVVTVATDDVTENFAGAFACAGAFTCAGAFAAAGATSVVGVPNQQNGQHRLTRLRYLARARVRACRYAPHTQRACASRRRVKRRSDISGEERWQQPYVEGRGQT